MSNKAWIWVLFPAVLVLLGFVYLIEYGPKGSLWVGVRAASCRATCGRVVQPEEASPDLISQAIWQR